MSIIVSPTIFYLLMKGEGQLVLIAGAAGCYHSNYTLTYECRVRGGGATVWKGSNFNCRNSNNEIILLHSRFSSGTEGTCNDGVILGRSVRVEGNEYTSQLSVMFCPNTTGDINCIYDNGSKPNTIGTITNSAGIVTIVNAPLQTRGTSTKVKGEGGIAPESCSF